MLRLVAAGAAFAVLVIVAVRVADTGLALPYAVGVAVAALIALKKRTP